MASCATHSHARRYSTIPTALQEGRTDPALARGPVRVSLETELRGDRFPSGTLVVTHKLASAVVFTAKRFHWLSPGLPRSGYPGKRFGQDSEPCKGSVEVLGRWYIGKGYSKRSWSTPRRYGTLSGFTRLAVLSPRVVAGRQPRAAVLNRFAVGMQNLCVTTRAELRGDRLPSRAWEPGIPIPNPQSLIPALEPLVDGGGGLAAFVDGVDHE